MSRRNVRVRGNDWRYARVGVVILLALALLIFVVYRIGDIFDLWTPRYELVTLFPSVTGLPPDASVTLAGRRVGKITSIELLTPEQRIGDNNVRVHFWVNEHVSDVIRTDSRARLRLAGLLGDRYLDIQPGSPGAPIAPRGTTLASVPPVELEEDILEPTAALLATAGVFMADLQSITASLARGEGTLGRLLVDDQLYYQMTRATAELSSMLADINQADGTLNRLIHDPTLYEQLTAALETVNDIGEQALHGDGTIGRLLHDDELYERMVGLTSSADLVLAELAEFTRGVATGDGTLQRLITDPTLYDQLLKTIVDLQYLVARIREDPRSIRPEVNIHLFR